MYAPSERFSTCSTDNEEQDGFAIVVADELNDQTKALKKAIFELTSKGDFVNYSNLKKGLYIDFSNQCQGLQIADICAGVFSATLKYESSPDTEKHKYLCGYNLFCEDGYKRIHSESFTPPCFDVYKYGIKEVPNGAGSKIAHRVSSIVEKALCADLEEEARLMFQDEYYK